MPSFKVASSPSFETAKPLSRTSVDSARARARALEQSLQDEVIRSAWAKEAKGSCLCEGAFERTCSSLAQFLIVSSWVTPDECPVGLIPSKGAFALYCTWKELDPIGFEKILVRQGVSPTSTVRLFEGNEEGETLATIFVGSCILEGLDPSQGVVPSVFSVDHAISWSQGWRFVRLDQPRPGVYHCALNEKGESRDRHWFVHAELSDDKLGQLVSLFGVCGKGYLQRRGSLYAAAALTVCSLFGYEHPSLAV